jgi:hypothetical protein
MVESVAKRREPVKELPMAHRRPRMAIFALLAGGVFLLKAETGQGAEV